LVLGFQLLIGDFIECSVLIDDDRYYW